MNYMFSFVFKCILSCAFASWYIECKKMHCINNVTDRNRKFTVSKLTFQRLRRTWNVFKEPFVPRCKLLNVYYKNQYFNAAKDKFVRIHVMKACSGSWGLAPLILNLEARWSSRISFTPQVALPWSEKAVTR